MEELFLDETPIQHVARMPPYEPPGKLRGRLAAGGIGADIAGTETGRLSGGQKSRLALILATLDAPHLIILDEPTNHLDIESRDALVEGLTEYGGAVILVSHDPHLVELVADRLWLVKGGRVAAFDDDMEGYRRILLAERNGTPLRARDDRAKPSGPATGRAKGRADASPLRAEVAKARPGVAKLAEMQEAIELRGSPTRCSIRAATPKRSGGCRRSAPRSRTPLPAPRRCGWRRWSG